LKSRQELLRSKNHNTDNPWITMLDTILGNWTRQRTVEKQEENRQAADRLGSSDQEKWPDMPHVLRLAPAGWKADRLKASDPVHSYYEESGVPDQESSRTWARLIAQVYEVDPLECPRCHSPMNVIAVITDPEEVHKILRHLVKIGRSPPGLDPNFV
jgi:hypothetical protein